MYIQTHARPRKPATWDLPGTILGSETLILGLNYAYHKALAWRSGTGLFVHILKWLSFLRSELQCLGIYKLCSCHLDTVSAFLRTCSPHRLTYTQTRWPGHVIGFWMLHAVSSAGVVNHNDGDASHVLLDCQPTWNVGFLLAFNATYWIVVHLEVSHWPSTTPAGPRLDNPIWFQRKTAPTMASSMRCPSMWHAVSCLDATSEHSQYTVLVAYH